MLSPVSEERRTGALEPFEKTALAAFALAAMIEAALGLYRARDASALIVPLLIAGCGGLWFLRERRMRGGGIAVPVGLLIATLGIYSAYTAINTPFLSIFGRFAVPALMIAGGAVLLFADQEWPFQRVPFAIAAIAFLVAQGTLTLEARNGSRVTATAATKLDGGIAGELELIPIAKTFLDQESARTHVPVEVTRWIAEDNTVVAFGTSSGAPAAWRFELRNGKIVEWQTYGGAK